MTLDLVALVEALPRPVCAELTPFTAIEARRDPAQVTLRFAPQPAFGNHFGHVQGGFAVAMLDALLSIAAYLDVGAWLPTVSITTQFLAPLPIGDVHGVGRVVRVGKSVVFTSASLSTPDGPVCVTATGTAAVRA